MYLTYRVKQEPKKLQIFLTVRDEGKKQLSVRGPRVTVLLGNTACNALPDTKIKITDVHGVVITENNRTYFITFHPACALRFSEGKKGFIEDFGKLKRV